MSVSIKDIVKNPLLIVAKLWKIFSPIVKSDLLYLKVRYRCVMKRRLNLDNPQTYNEKLQWIKLYYRKPIMTKMVDKYAAKEYVANIIGEEYIIPTLGVWDSVEDIDFDALPNRFVLKPTHDSGEYIICKDKSNLDKEKALKKLKKSLKRNYFYENREWPYKDVKPRIIAEQYMEDERGELNDYKFFCFDGEVKAILIATERHTKHGPFFDYFDKDFNHFPFEQGGPNSNKQIEKPEKLDEMCEMARKLSKGIPHVRVDLYCVKGQIYFGELTFFDSSGMAEFNPEEWNYTFGSWIKLPINNYANE